MGLSWLLKNAKGHDLKSFYTRPAFADVPTPTIELTSPDCGPDGSRLAVEYTYDGKNRIPALKWSAPLELRFKVKEWLLLVEDPDAPISTPNLHGLYTGIPASKTSVVHADFEKQNEAESLLKGGFHYGYTRGGVVYLPVRPLMNHGPHRYFFQIVALSQPLDKALLKKQTTREQVEEAIRGKVLGWGKWVCVAERTFKSS